MASDPASIQRLRGAAAEYELHRAYDRTMLDKWIKALHTASRTARELAFEVSYRQRRFGLSADAILDVAEVMEAPDLASMRRALEGQIGALHCANPEIDAARWRFARMTWTWRHAPQMLAQPLAVGGMNAVSLQSVGEFLRSLADDLNLAGIGFKHALPRRKGRGRPLDAAKHVLLARSAGVAPDEIVAAIEGIDQIQTPDGEGVGPKHLLKERLRDAQRGPARKRRRA
jgi:hypothetical protein